MKRGSLPVYLMFEYPINTYLRSHMIAMNRVTEGTGYRQSKYTGNIITLSDLLNTQQIAQGKIITLSNSLNTQQIAQGKIITLSDLLSMQQTVKMTI